MSLKPIETRYNGFRFRSRLEARWAVFFDVVGIEYQYEPQGFTLCNGQAYLPDFYLPKYDCWVEVKGVIDRKAVETILHACLSGLDNIILLGEVPRVFNQRTPVHNGYTLCDSDNGPRGVLHVPISLDVNDCQWGFDFGAPPAHFIYEDGQFDCCDEKCRSGCDGMPIKDKSFYDTASVGLRTAYDQARQARFEHGEVGR